MTTLSFVVLQNRSSNMWLLGHYGGTIIDTNRCDHFQFGSVFIKKNNQTEIFFKKNWNRTETRSNRPISVLFGSVRFFREKTGSNQFGSVFPVWLGSGSVLARFFSVSVRFSFFSFLFVKPKPNRTGWFFKILIDFFFGSVFSIIFFSGFLGLIGFFVFLLTSRYQ